jgi:ribosomal protein L20A (L18A)
MFQWKKRVGRCALDKIYHEFGARKKGKFISISNKQFDMNF